MLAGWPYADVIKLNEEELEFLTGDSDITHAARRLWRANLRLLVVTRGAAGSTYFTFDAEGATPGFTVEAVDTTGAGDGFVAGMLSGLLDADLDWDEAALQHAMRLGNAVGALTATRRGAIPALPVRDDALRLIEERR